MAEKEFKYGGLMFSRDEIGVVRQLGRGKELRCDHWWHHADRTVMLLLKSKGLCTVESNGKEWKLEVLTYRATPLMLGLAEKQRASTKTFDQLAQQMGLDISPAAIKGRMRKKRLAPLSCTRYPAIRDLEHQRLIEQQGPFYTEAPAVEPGEVPLFSSRGLTDWYVGEFCKLNLLRT